jgi:transcriptional regulator with XRE-family HTH domain
MNTFSEDRLRCDIRASGLSQLELARRSGVNQGSISRFLAGKSLHSKNLEKLWPILYGPDSPIVLAMEAADQVLEHEEARHGS